ncbi:hypothetical protein BpHYR1_031150 [Brachionus plicatilis]|uniref:Uncharacterized protein n=1 Tax=Brachionus plicatilis TaxID=10195 RepID=A0A3M7SE85_BRAPC|nr:hypothetical protein BpHYR1_031150 [Brachionus plicatilis]
MNLVSKWARLTKDSVAFDRGTVPISHNHIVYNFNVTVFTNICLRSIFGGQIEVHDQIHKLDTLMSILNLSLKFSNKDFQIKKFKDSNNMKKRH